MDNKSKILYISLCTAMMIVAVAALLPIMKVSWIGTRYLFAIGAVGILIVRLFQRYKGDNLRIKRLHRMERVSALCFCVSAALMFFPMETATDWVVFLLVGALLQLYTSFMIESVTKKEKKEGAK